jgi:SET and MYND domain-containing protein
LTRLRDGEEGLSLAHSDLRLLLRALAVRRRALDAAADGDASDDDSDEDDDDPAAAAAAEDGDVIVDGYDSLEGLMSGMDGGDDGELPDAAGGHHRGGCQAMQISRRHRVQGVAR